MSTRAATLEQGPFGPRIQEPVQDRVFLRGPKESISDRLRAAVSNVAHDLSTRIAQDKAVVATGLERARATITQVIHEKTVAIQNVGHAVSTVVTKENMAKVGHVAQQIGAYAIDHKAEIAKKAAPAVATAVGVNIAGGAFAAPVALVREVSSGISNIRHNTHEIKGKDIFATSAALRRGFGREQRLTDMNVDTTPVSEPRRLFQKVSQSKLGRAFNGYLHFEEHVTARFVANNSHIRTIHQIADGKTEEEIRKAVTAIKDIQQLFDLRSSTVMARLTAGPQERQTISMVHRAVTERIKYFKSETREESRRDPDSSAYAGFMQIERDFKQREHRAYHSTVRSALGVSLGANLVKTALTTATFFLGGRLLGLHTQDPLEKSKFWSNLAEHVGSSLRTVSSDVGQSTASVLGIDPVQARHAVSPMMDMTHAGVNHNAHSVYDVSEQYASFTNHTDHPAVSGLPLDNHTPESVPHLGIVKGHYSLSQEALDRSVVSPSMSASARSGVSMNDLVTEKRQLADHAVPRIVSATSHSSTGTDLGLDTDTRLPVYVMRVDNQTSLTQRIWDMRDNPAVAKALPFISEAESVTEAFSGRDSGSAMWKLIQANNHLVTSEGYDRLKAIVEDPENTHASFGAIWYQYHALYPDDHFGGLDNLGYGGNTGIVTFYDRGMIDDTVSASSIAGSSVAKVEGTGTIETGHRVLGHARPSRSALFGSRDLSPPTPTSNIKPSIVDPVSLFGGEGTTAASTSARTATSTLSAGGIRPSSTDAASLWGDTAGADAHKDLTVGDTLTPPSSASAGVRASALDPASLWDTADPSSSDTLSSSLGLRGSSIRASTLDATDLFTRTSDTSSGASSIRPSSVDPRLLFENSTEGSSPVTVTTPDFIAESRFPWFDQDLTYSTTFDSPETSFGFKLKTIPVIPMDHEGSGAYNTVTGYLNSFGGLNLELHSGELETLGVQAFEPIREYLQGGAHSPRLGPVQEAYRAEQLIQAYPYININMSGQQVGGVLNSFHHVTISSGGSLIVPGTDIDGIIGGGPDITALIGCSRGHVQAIQMLINMEADVPAEFKDALSDSFKVLLDETSDGTAIEQAVDKIVKVWFKNTDHYAEFYKLYGYLWKEEPNIPKMEKNGFFTAGRLVLELNNSAPHGA